ncbi:transcriptional regulator, partial [Acinetobacter baumannii]
MYTICETPLFTKYCLVYWTQEEYEEFKTFLALNPEAGDVEPNSGGIRKIRWTSG